MSSRYVDRLDALLCLLKENTLGKQRVLIDSFQSQLKQDKMLSQRQLSCIDSISRETASRLIQLNEQERILEDFLKTASVKNIFKLAV